ncbi:hypothetical protein EV426DRAFT_572976 [Tirmania nivea]|nr:hypothetical protein EV426DRAFT_572976 [Tirmania nivea]
MKRPSGLTVRVVLGDEVGDLGSSPSIFATVQDFLELQGGRGQSSLQPQGISKSVKHVKLLILMSSATSYAGIISSQMSRTVDKEFSSPVQLPTLSSVWSRWAMAEDFLTMLSVYAVPIVVTVGTNGVGAQPD